MAAENTRLGITEIHVQYFPFKPNHYRKPHRITRQDVLAAMSIEKLRGREGKKFVVAKVNRDGPQPDVLFSPKDIIRECLKDQNASFGGGVVSNKASESLGFPVGRKKELKKRLNERSRSPAPSVSNLCKRLFEKKWQTLPDETALKRNESLQCPGVYVLAFADPQLRGKRIAYEDIWYVGMTNEGGLHNRLSQFVRAANGKKGHSAGTRFRRIWLKQQKQKSIRAMHPVYAYCALECETEKPWRSANDLQKMGTVAAVEYEVLSSIKRKIGFEPILNKK
jgi:hypothetical protein